LTDAHLTLYGRAGATVSRSTRRNYRQGVVALVAAWRQENLLRPRRDAGALWLRTMEDAGLKPPTMTARLAGARALYAALRWAGATEADPLRDAHPQRDLVPAWEKRKPYDPDEVRRLVATAHGDDLALVLLGAHTGLRVSEMLALRWADVAIGQRELLVRKGKGCSRGINCT
jgi:integrase